MRRRQFLAFAAGAFAVRWPRAAPVPLHHEHGHGLSFSADGKALLAPSDHGLAVYEGAIWQETSSTPIAFTGFSVAAHAVYASGTAHGVPTGLLRSTDTGGTWHAAALAGEADFALLAAGHKSGALYGLTRHHSRALPATGIYRTSDEGRTWQHAAARGVEGEIHGLAAHPLEPATLAIGTGLGLYVSFDGGERFRRLDGRQPVTALAFDFDGRHVWYARPLANDLVRRPLATPSRRSSSLPPLGGDYVTCLAQSPADAATIAFATRRRDVYLTPDGGREWRRITDEGRGFERDARGHASNEHVE